MSDTSTIHRELSAALSPTAVLRQEEPMARHTTMHIGGCADLYLEPDSESDLAVAIQFCDTRNVPVLLLGRGSNLLVRDGGVRGLVVSFSKLSSIRVEGCLVHCGAGAKLKNLAWDACRAGVAGFEFLEGIPGSVGGALRMNAGAMGGAIFDRVESVRVMDYSGQVHEYGISQIAVHYRSCPLIESAIALGAVLRGTSDKVDAISERMKAYSQKRWTAQPKEPSAGCTFKNPGLVPAGKLIDQLGLKGARVGGAVISNLHGNFIVNDGNATARDVLALIEMVKKQAKAAQGIELETEIEIVGED